MERPTERTSLSATQIASFHRDGFLVVRGMYEPPEVDEISRWTDEVAAFPEVPGRYMMYFEQSRLEPGQRIVSRVENLCPYHRGFAALFDGGKMRGSVSQLFGEPAVLFKDKINFKLPGGDGFKPHQDVQAGWNTYASLHISVLVCIDAATVENGCIALVSGYHGLVGAMWTPMSEEDMAGMAFIPCPTRAGDVVFFDSFAPHASAANLSDRPRRVLYVTYNRRSEGDQRERYYADKRRSYPPDCEREPGKQYVFRV